MQTNTKIICLECDRDCKNAKSLGMHLSKTHKMKRESYTLKHIHNSIRPKCLCGCDIETSWSNIHLKFMKYRSGHNEGQFSTTNQPTFTSDQIEHRNNKIRKTYAGEQGVLIKEKIRNSVNETFLQPGFIEKLSASQRSAQARPDVKANVIASRKRAWKEQYDSLCEKIFTEEFGQKISEANMRRDIKRQSNAEIKFFEHLKQKFPNVETSVWTNNLNLLNKKKTFCFDGKINDLILEFDGTYWHGLDRSQRWNAMQLHNITNDLKKSQTISENNLKLLRFREDVDYANVDSIEKLYDAAYFVQHGDEIIKGKKCIINESSIVCNKNDIDNDELLTFLLLYSLVFDLAINPKKLELFDDIIINNLFDYESFDNLEEAHD